MTGEQIYERLPRLIARHPLARRELSYSSLDDLQHDLYLVLLSKNRFAHFAETGMTDAEIERQIYTIELKNLLLARLRWELPESFRLARRISRLIQTSKAFKRFDTHEDASRPHRRAAVRLYGLAEWELEKQSRNAVEMKESALLVSPVQRDTRTVGCTGDVQIVITNIELEKLIVRVFKAIDSPASLSSLRSLVLSRLPVMDIYLVSMGGGSEDQEDKMEFDLPDKREFHALSLPAFNILCLNPTSNPRSNA